MWNQCEALTALQDYVQDVTNANSPNYIKEEDRIATFDMDGTFVGELYPTYFEYNLMEYRALTESIGIPSNRVIGMDVKLVSSSQGTEEGVNYTMGREESILRTDFMLIADDDVRDHANREKALTLGQQWREAGYHVISMRDDFKTIYGEGVMKTDFSF